MENILIGTKVPDLSGKEFTDLVKGEIALYLHNADGATPPVLRGSEVTNAEVKAARAIQFIVKKADGEINGGLLIPNRTLLNQNYQAYQAGVAAVVKLGNNATTDTSLIIPSTGEGNIRLTNLTDTYEIDNFPANISVTKKSTETPVQYLARVVAAINANPTANLLVTAELETAAAKYQIKLTTKNSTIKLGVATDGVFADYQAIQVTARVTALGDGATIQKIEKELTVFKGNGNYTEDNDLYYKEPLVSNAALNYNVMSITWTSVVHPTHSTTMTVANPNILVCTPSTDTTLADLFTKFT